MAAKLSFFKIVGNDLFAHTKRRGFIAFLSGLVFEPGFHFLFGYRFVQVLYRRRFRRTAKIIWRINSMMYGCYFHLTSEIESGLYLPHPTGIVIGEGVRIGKNVTLYQSVTIGKGKEENSYPYIANGVTIFPNSVVFGDIVIGESAIIGAGSIVKRNVLPNTVFKEGQSK